MSPPPASQLAVVTGGNAGIGLAVAHELAARGHRLLLVARDGARLEAARRAIADRHGAAAETRVCDLSDAAATAVLAADLAVLGPDMLVNNSGFGDYGPFADLSAENAAGMIATNVAALTCLTSAVLPAMRARGAGRILNVASTAAFAPLPLAAVYGATKAYVLSFSLALAEELAQSGVTVTALCPGPTPTGFAARAGMTRTELFRGAPLTGVEAVAAQGVAAMMAGRTMVVVGGANRLLAFATRFVPRGLAARISHRAMRERLG
jgi:short-subunit dehydrogenase